jgi:hypothetical protein
LCRANLTTICQRWRDQLVAEFTEYQLKIDINSLYTLAGALQGNRLSHAGGVGCLDWLLGLDHVHRAVRDASLRCCESISVRGAHINDRAGTRIESVDASQKVVKPPRPASLNGFDVSPHLGRARGASKSIERRQYLVSVTLVKCPSPFSQGDMRYGTR